MTCHAYEKMRAVLEELKPLVWLDITHAKIKEALALPCSCGTELEEFYKDGFEDGRIAGFVEANEEKEGDASCPELEKENIAVLVERIKRRSESESPPNIVMESKLDIAQNIIRQLERKLADRHKLCVHYEELCKQYRDELAAVNNAAENMAGSADADIKNLKRELAEAKAVLAHARKEEK